MLSAASHLLNDNLEQPVAKKQKTTVNTGGDKSVSVAFWAHKGGVGKTMLLWATADELAKRGMRVVVVDADPQMNSTFQALGMEVTPQMLTGLIGQQESAAERVDIGLGRPLPTLYSYLAIGGRRVTLDALVKVKDGVRLLVGSPFVTELEAQLAMSILTPNQFPGAADIKNFMKRLLTDLKGMADVVLVDMSPSAGMLTQNVLSAVDKIVLPVTPDMHSLLGLDLLAGYLKRWDSMHGTYGGKVSGKVCVGVFNRDAPQHSALYTMAAERLSRMGAPLLRVAEGHPERISQVVDRVLLK